MSFKLENLTRFHYSQLFILRVVIIPSADEKSIKLNLGSLGYLIIQLYWYVNSNPLNFTSQSLARDDR